MPLPVLTYYDLIVVVAVWCHMGNGTMIKRGRTVDNPNKLSWTSNVTVYESFDTALNDVVKREGVKVVHGLDEARLETLRETEIDGMRANSLC